MLEYVFFHEEPRQRFLNLLDERGLHWTLEVRDPETLVVVDESKIDDELAEYIESVYDDLFAMEQSIYESSRPPSADNYSASGVVVNLKDGRRVYANLPLDLVNRVLSVLSPEELGTLVDAIVSAVEDPDERALCQRGHEGG